MLENSSCTRVVRWSEPSLPSPLPTHRRLVSEGIHIVLYTQNYTSNVDNGEKYRSYYEQDKLNRRKRAVDDVIDCSTKHTDIIYFPLTGRWHLFRRSFFTSILSVLHWVAISGDIPWLLSQSARVWPSGGENKARGVSVVTLPPSIVLTSFTTFSTTFWGNIHFFVCN